MYGVRMHIETKQIITLREFAEKRTLIVFIICGYSTTVSVSVFQTENVGSIPITRSKIKLGIHSFISKLYITISRNIQIVR